MNRRAFFRFLPAAAVSTVAQAAGALAGPVRAEDVEGITIAANGPVHISGCHFGLTRDTPAITIAQMPRHFWPKP